MYNKIKIHPICLSYWQTQLMSFARKTDPTTKHAHKTDPSGLKTDPDIKFSDFRYDMFENHNKIPE